MGAARVIAVIALALMPGPLPLAQSMVACDGLQCVMSQSDFERVLKLIEVHREMIERLQQEVRLCQA